MKIFTSPTQKLGETGERAAEGFLLQKGFTIIDRNIAGRYGEIDIIALKNNRYYFFEVKTARMGSFIRPADNLTSKKLRKVVLSVQYYCFIQRIKEYKIQGILVVVDQKGDSDIEIIDIS